MTNQKYWHSVLESIMALEQAETQDELERIVGGLKALTVAQLAILS